MFIAVILAVTLPSLWPAALSIAISGAAIALAFKVYAGDESPDLSGEVSELQEANLNLRADLEKSNNMLEELADVIEQIATVTANDANTFQPQIDGLRTDLFALQSAPVPEPVIDTRLDALPVLNSRVDEINLRLVALENTISQQAYAHNGAVGLAGPLSPSAPVAEVPTTNPGDLRSLIARAGGAIDTENKDGQSTEESDAAEMPGIVKPDVSLTPVFDPGLGAPVAFILSVQSDSVESVTSVLLKHAVQISTELEEAGRPILLLVRMSPETLSDQSVRNELLSAIEASHALQLRLTLLTQQQGFDVNAQSTLAAIAEHGCKFAMEDIRDWSLDLAGLATSGLRFIIVDAVAMANSAREQGGDPRRLAQALAIHDIALIGGSVASKDDMETVRTLEPALVTGDGLGPARILDALS